MNTLRTYWEIGYFPECKTRIQSNKFLIAHTVKIVTYCITIVFESLNRWCSFTRIFSKTRNRSVQSSLCARIAVSSIMFPRSHWQFICCQQVVPDSWEDHVLTGQDFSWEEEGPVTQHMLTDNRVEFKNTYGALNWPILHANSTPFVVVDKIRQIYKSLQHKHIHYPINAGTY